TTGQKGDAAAGTRKGRSEAASQEGRRSPKAGRRKTTKAGKSPGSQRASRSQGRRQGNHSGPQGFPESHPPIHPSDTGGGREKTLSPFPSTPSVQRHDLSDLVCPGRETAFFVIHPRSTASRSAFAGGCAAGVIRPACCRA